MEKSPAKQEEKARMQKMKEDNSFRLGQMISNQGDTTSFELRPTGTGETTKKIISNEEYKKRMSGSSSIAKQTGETVNTAGQVIPTGIGDAAPNNAFNASVAPPQPNRAGAPPRSTANLNMGIGVDPNRSNFRNNQAANNAALAGGGNVPGMQVPQTMAAKKGWIQDANIQKGGLHETLGIPEDEKIPRGPGSKFQAALQGKFGKKGKRQAKLAETFKKMNK